MHCNRGTYAEIPEYLSAQQGKKKKKKRQRKKRNKFNNEQLS